MDPHRSGRSPPSHPGNIRRVYWVVSQWPASLTRITLPRMMRPAASQQGHHSPRLLWGDMPQESAAVVAIRARTDRFTERDTAPISLSLFPVTPFSIRDHHFDHDRTDSCRRGTAHASPAGIQPTWGDRMIRQPGRRSHGCVERDARDDESIYAVASVHPSAIEHERRST